MPKTLIALVVGAVLAALAVPALAATRSVAVGDNFFVRDSDTVPTVNVRRGDTVRWRFRGQIIHNVTVTRGPAKFKSPTKSSGTYSKRLTRRGTYTIICTIHGAGDQQMKLRVR